MPDEQLIRNTLEALSGLPVAVGKIDTRLDAAAKKFDELDAWIHDVETRRKEGDVELAEALRDLRDELRRELGETRTELKREIGDARKVCDAIATDVKDGRRNILIAIIGFGGTLCAALVSAAVALIVHFA